MSIQAGGGVRKKKLLLLDTGDNCRCPMAEGYLKKLLYERGIDWIDVSTAGVMTPTGLLPTPEAEQLLLEEGVDISRHRSRPMKAHMLEDADLILGMSSLHVQKAIRETEAAKGKTFLLKEYVGYSGKHVQIPDPMGGTMDTFKRVFEQLKDALEKLVETEFIRTPPPGWKSAAPLAAEGESVEQVEEEPTPAETVLAHTESPSSSAAGETKAASAAEEEVTLPKRKRGRPRKAPAETPTPAPAPRKRGRPRKEGAAEFQAAAQKEKKRRGRPPKADSEKKTTAPAAKRKSKGKTVSSKKKAAETAKKKSSPEAKTRKSPARAVSKPAGRVTKKAEAGSKGARSRKERHSTRSRKK